MNRLVEQLLCVARLDSVALDVSLPVDLRQLAEDVVGSMAHLALSARRSIALIGADQPVNVIGNPPAITDALRNLIENALVHTGQGTEVTVEVDLAGAISVQDSGRASRSRIGRTSSSASGEAKVFVARAPVWVWQSLWKSSGRMAPA